MALNNIDVNNHIKDRQTPIFWDRLTKRLAPFNSKPSHKLLKLHWHALTPTYLHDKCGINRKIIHNLSVQKVLPYHMGSKRSFSFHTQVPLESPDRDKLFVFARPEDAISFYDLHEKHLKHIKATFVAVKQPSDINRFMRHNVRRFSDIRLCFDNSKAGRSMTERIMSSEHDKARFAKLGNKFVNMATDNMQTISVSVPGATYDRQTNQVERWMPSSLGSHKYTPDNWKNDTQVLQGIHGKGAFAPMKGSGFAKAIAEHPTQKLNISQYSQMISDDCLNSLTVTERPKARKFFAQCYGLASDMSRTDSASMTPFYSQVASIKATFNDLHSDTRQILMDTVQHGGGKYISAHDWQIYANHYGYQKRMPNADMYTVGRAADVNASTQTFRKGIARGVSETMRQLPKNYQRVYDLALRAHKMQVNPPVDKHLLGTSLGRKYGKYLSSEGKVLYQGTMKDLKQANTTYYWFVKDSIVRNFHQAYQANAGMPYSYVTEASGDFLKANRLSHYPYKQFLYVDKMQFNGSLGHTMHVISQQNKLVAQQYQRAVKSHRTQSVRRPRRQHSEMYYYMMRQKHQKGVEPGSPYAKRPFSKPEVKQVTKDINSQSKNTRDWFMKHYLPKQVAVTNRKNRNNDKLFSHNSAKKQSMQFGSHKLMKQVHTRQKRQSSSNRKHFQQNYREKGFNQN